MKLKSSEVLGVFVLVFCVLIAAIVLVNQSPNVTPPKPCPPPSCPTQSCPQPDPPTLHVPVPPEVVMLDNKPNLIYEVYYANHTPLTLNKIEVIDRTSNRVIATVSGIELDKSIRQPQKGISDYVVFLMVEPDNIPTSLTHRLYFVAANGSSQTIQGADTLVKNQTTLTIGPPVRGPGWIGLNAPSNYLNHRRIAIIEFMGRINIPQRYAVDWTQMGPNGKVFRTDGTTNEDYYGYGADLIAVADGRIVDQRDLLNNTIPFHAPPATEPILGGNYVLLDIGNGNYAFYAHAINGSFTHNIGDHVKKGEVLAKLGSSGNSDLPHLHFHICNSTEFLMSEGVPYMIDDYDVTGEVVDWEEVLTNNSTWNGTLAQPIEYTNSSMPKDGDVVTFG